MKHSDFEATSIFAEALAANYEGRAETNITADTLDDGEVPYWGLALEEASEVVAPAAKLLRISGQREIPGVLPMTPKAEKEMAEELLKEFMDFGVALTEAARRNPILRAIPRDQLIEFSRRYGQYKAARYYARNNGQNEPEGITCPKLFDKEE